MYPTYAILLSFSPGEYSKERERKSVREGQEKDRREKERERRE